jgi:uncharacterized membrane protein YfcA
VDVYAIATRASIGLIAGMLIGLTGIGGGVVLLPLLISILRVPPIIAVGSDAVINSITKIGAGTLHWRRGNVSWPLTLNLACGSIPGAVLGVLFLARIRAVYGSEVNDVLKVAIAILLMVIPIAYMFIRPSSAFHGNSRSIGNNKHRLGVTLIGFVAGILVGVTSIGSGSIILLLLLVFYGYAPVVMVGTDIVHAVLLAGITGFLQWELGNVDPVLVATVLIGSIPGGLLGAYLTKYLPSLLFKRTLCSFLVVVGARMLWMSVPHAK